MKFPAPARKNFKKQIRQQRCWPPFIKILIKNTLLIWQHPDITRFRVLHNEREPWIANWIAFPFLFNRNYEKFGSRFLSKFFKFDESDNICDGEDQLISKPY